MGCPTGFEPVLRLPPRPAKASPLLDANGVGLWGRLGLILRVILSIFSYQHIIYSVIIITTTHEARNTEPAKRGCDTRDIDRKALDESRKKGENKKAMSFCRSSLFCLPPFCRECRSDWVGGGLGRPIWHFGHIPHPATHYCLIVFSAIKVETRYAVIMATIIGAIILQNTLAFQPCLLSKINCRLS